MNNNNKIYVKVDRYTGSQIMAKDVYYNEEMMMVAAEGLMNVRAGRDPWAAKVDCEGARIADAIQMVSRGDKQRKNYRAYRAAKKAAKL